MGLSVHPEGTIHLQPLLQGLWSGTQGRDGLQAKPLGHRHDLRILKASIAVANRNALRIQIRRYEPAEGLLRLVLPPLDQHLRAGIPAGHLQLLGNQGHAWNLVVAHLLDPFRTRTDYLSTWSRHSCLQMSSPAES